jgi:hypothetical protein
MKLPFLLYLSFVLCIIQCIHAVEEEEEDEEPKIENPERGGDGGNPFDFKSQKEAITAWGKSLTNEDLTPTSWTKQPQYMFEMYSLQLSAIFKDKGAKVNFALVGACDGTHDKTITEGYLPNDHWRGVFVEPFEINFNDLKNFMISKNVLDRTHLIHAAATSRCNSTTIKMKRPTFEEKNKTLPHWMRREIGAIVPFDKLDRPAMGIKLLSLFSFSLSFVYS